MNAYAFMWKDWHACPERSARMFVDVHGHVHRFMHAGVRAGVCVCVRTYTLKWGSLSLVAGCAGGEFFSSWMICPFQSWGQVWLSGCLPRRSGAGQTPGQGPPYLFLPLPPSPDLSPPSHTLASITAEKKVPKSSAGWRQKRHQKTPSCHRPQTKEAPSPPAPARPTQEPPIPSASRWAVAGMKVPLTSPTLILLSSSSSRPLICGHSE